MENINQTKFINFLNSFNIDLNSFKDLSFDGLCEEKSLQHFLSWICSSLNEENLRKTSSNINININDDTEINTCEHEPIGESYDDLFDDIVDSLNIKLRCSEKLKTKFVELDDKLRQKEKSVYEEILKGQKLLAAAVADCKMKQLEDEIEIVYKLLLNTNPYVPNIESYNQKAESLLTSIQELYKTSVDMVEDKFNEEHNSFEPPVADFEDIAFKIQLQDNMSNRQLNATQQWLENIKTPVDFKYLLSLSEWNIPEYNRNSNVMNKIVYDAKVASKGIAVQRKTIIKKRKHSVNLYLKNQLMENNKLLHKSLIYSSLAQSFINVRSNKMEELSTLVDDFFSSISIKCDSVNSIVNSCKANASVFDNPVARGTTTVNTERIGICHDLLQSLKNEYIKNQAFRENIRRSLQYFRNGPTLRFCFLPMDLIVQFDNCRKLHEKVAKDLRQNAGYYCNIKSKIRGDHDRTQQLMWVFFLTDPSKLASIQLDYSSFNITFRN